MNNHYGEIARVCNSVLPSQSRAKFLQCLALLLGLFMLVSNARAQQASPNRKRSESPSVITVGSSAAAPGDLVVAPVYFTPAEGAQVGKLKVVITFVSANLKFSKV